MKIKSSYFNNELIEFINDRDEEENVNIENDYYYVVDALYDVDHFANWIKEFLK